MTEDPAPDDTAPDDTAPDDTAPDDTAPDDGDDDGGDDKAERAQRAHYHVAAQQRRSERESAKAQVFVDRFVARATEAGVPTEELTAAPWTGRGRYRTDVQGWYLRQDRSIGVGVDGGYYVLVVAPQRFGHWRRIPIDRTAPPLQVGQGARDGESVTLQALLELRLQWPDVPNAEPS